MSVEERLTAALGPASAEFGNKNYVAILGFSGVGKTVLVTLLNNAIENYFLEKYPDITSRIVSGRPFLEAWEGNMLDGEFPQRTQPLARDEIVITMSRRGATGTSTEIRLPDISGETFNQICLGDEVVGKERVLKILDTAKPKGKTHGDMGYIIYAKMYLILLDCSKMSDWEKLGIKYGHALATIHDIKEVIKETKNGRVQTPIGILLTKADTLPNPDESAQTVIHNNMRRFLNTLNDMHEGKKEYFKLHVDVERNSNNEINDPSNLKVKKPLAYSRDEYVSLIHWIHENI